MLKHVGFSIIAASWYNFVFYPEYVYQEVTTIYYYMVIGTGLFGMILAAAGLYEESKWK